MKQETNRYKQTDIPPERLSFKLIKRRYKLTNENFAMWFNYANAANFRRSFTLYRYLTRMTELMYRRYVIEGKAAAISKAGQITWPAECSQDRQRDYKDGLVMFITKIDKIERAGSARDPEPSKYKR